MERSELLQSKEYWSEKIKLDLYQVVLNYKNQNKLTLDKLAVKLGVTKGYLSQVLNGNFDHKISKLVELAIACNMVPVIKYEPMDQYLTDDAEGNCDGHYKDRPLIKIDLNFEDTKKNHENAEIKGNREEYEVIPF